MFFAYQVLMKFSWSNSVFPIAVVFSFRMLGLFMLIPVFTLYAPQLTGATPALIGFALGGYGLSQGILQLPFGMLSDRFGRKPIITLGLCLFALGSLIGAITHSIYGMILARILQGTGAIGSVLIALLADLTPDEQRTKSMAVIGMTIGLSFSLAMIISPPISRHFGLQGIFYLSFIMALLGLALLHLMIRKPPQERFHADAEAKISLLKIVIKNRHLLRLDFGIFCQHFVLTATFFEIPLLLQQQLKQGNLAQQWQFYLPLMVFSFLMMIPFIAVAERKRKMKPLFLLAVILTAFTQCFLSFAHGSWWFLCLLMFLYFTAFNFLEASLPSLVSRQADPASKGTAMGVYSSCQFLGIFCGGAAAGLFYPWAGSSGIFLMNASLALLWGMVAVFMKPNVYLSTVIVHFDPFAWDKTELMNKLKPLSGVNHLLVSEEEQVIYIQICRERYLTGSVEQVLAEKEKRRAALSTV